VGCGPLGALPALADIVGAEAESSASMAVAPGGCSGPFGPESARTHNCDSG
jgi:hypothetical protein